MNSTIDVIYIYIYIHERNLRFTLNRGFCVDIKNYLVSICKCIYILIRTLNQGFCLDIQNIICYLYI